MRLLLIIVCGLGMATMATAQPVDSLRVMTYNIWVGGTAYGQPLSRTVNVIQSAQADVVGIQEQGSNGPAIAASLGFYYHNLGGSTAILSRYPIVQHLNHGAKLRLSDDQEAYIFDVHFAPYPYQPYDIRDGLIHNESQAIAAAQATRGASTTALLSDMSGALASHLPVFLTGDFNEPSHLDWTQEAASAGLHFNMKVNWPTSLAVVNAGLTDAFRELRPDEVGDTAYTWTPGYPPPSTEFDEVQDRIDFVYYAGVNVSPSSAAVLGHSLSDPNTDIAVPPYPSDHRSVVVEFDVPACSVFGDLTGDCAISPADWSIFRAGQHEDLSELSPRNAYLAGDLNGDFRNNHADFALFKSSYEVANGAGSFSEMLSHVPEPQTVIFAASAILIGISYLRPAR